MSRFLIVGAALALAPLYASAAADSFPRIAANPIGSPQNYWDADYQKRIAALDVAVLAVWPGWGSSAKTDMTQTVKQIKAINPKTRIFLYVIAESFKDPMPAGWEDLDAKVNQQKWWLYPTSTSGSPIEANFGHGTYVFNITNFAPKDKDGNTWGSWYANYVNDKFGKPNPYIDGFYTDNVFYRPRTDGDWNLDGKVDSQKDPVVQTWYREGYRSYFAALRKAMPGKMQIGNVADWGQPGTSTPEYQDMINGGIIEGILGKNYSAEGASADGWQRMMAQYRKIMALLAAPKLALFNQGGDPKDYQGMRYGLASCLMDDGYYDFNDEAHGYSGLTWFDEFDVDLGDAASTPTTVAWQKGVYRRDFTKGIALVNPKGNGPQTVTLDGEYYLIKGKQDPAVNTGALVKTVTLKDRDGIILLRKVPLQKRPSPPGSLQVTAAGN